MRKLSICLFAWQSCVLMNFLMWNSIVNGDTLKSCNNITCLIIYTKQLSIIAKFNCYHSRGFVHPVRHVILWRQNSCQLRHHQHDGPPKQWTVVLYPFILFYWCIYLVRQSHFILEEIISNYNLHISNILIASQNCLNISCHVGSYTGRFSCNCNLALRLVQ